MTLISIFLIAIGLSMDAFAVAVTCGLNARPLQARYAFRIAFLFGLFQALMPLMGWVAGVGLRTIIASFDHWIAFLLLAAIGGKMIYESLRAEKKPVACRMVPIGGLLVLALATSIDALAVGVSFAFLEQAAIIGPALMIGLITFVVCLGGVRIGNRFGHFFENKFEMLGGLILIGIALKILLSHIMT